MWGNIVVAVIGVLGALVPLYWGTRGDARERAALKELVELLKAVPEDFDSTDLKSLLRARFKALAVEAHPDKESRRRRHIRAIWLIGIGLPLFLFSYFGIAWWVMTSIMGPQLEYFPEAPSWLVVAGAAGFVSAYPLLIFGWREMRRYRREEAAASGSARQEESRRPASDPL